LARSESGYGRGGASIPSVDETGTIGAHVPRLGGQVYDYIGFGVGVGAFDSFRLDQVIVFPAGNEYILTATGFELLGDESAEETGAAGEHYLFGGEVEFWGHNKFMGAYRQIAVK
jgi:hypothetical protein